MEDSYAKNYPRNSIRISSKAREFDNILESFPPDPLSRRGPEGALCIDQEITPPVLILSDSDSGSREVYTALQ